MKHRKSIDLFAPFAPANFYEHDRTQYQTIQGLREWEVLGAKCGKCGHVAWLDKKVVEREWGNHYLMNLPWRLRCQCGYSGEETKVLIGNLGRG